MKLGMKDSEFDYYRWIGYGVVLLILAILAIFVPLLIWVFAIMLIITLLDMGYCQYFKYRFFSKVKK